jgi:hypothetical protein
MNLQQNIPTWCVPSSVLCALIYGIKEKRPVRIAIFHIRPGLDHAQAQVQADSGEWCYLTEYWTGQSMAAQLYRENCDDTLGRDPYRYVGVREFLAEQATALGLEDIL